MIGLYCGTTFVGYSYACLLNNALKADGSVGIALTSKSSLGGFCAVDESGSNFIFIGPVNSDSNNKDWTVITARKASSSSYSFSTFQIKMTKTQIQKYLDGMDGFLNYNVSSSSYYAGIQNAANIVGR